MALSPSHLREIAHFAANDGQFERLPPEVAAISKEIMVNAAAVGLAGAAQEDGQTMTRFVQEMGGNGKCTIIGKGLRTSPVYAALTNGLLIHLLDFDDEIPANGSHPGSAIFPAVMALGEMNGIPGKDVLAAFATGYEVASKLQSFCITGENAEVEAREASVLPYGSASTIGATVASAMLLGLDEEQMTQALLMASDRAFPSSPVASAGPTRSFRQGQAAMSGITASLLVSQGLSADPVIPGEQGGPSARASQLDQSGPASWTGNVGKPFDVVGLGVGLRIYPCASQAHTAIDACLQLIQQYRVTADEIEAVRVEVTSSALEALPYPTPANGWEARACLSFIVASTLTYGHPLIDNFTDAAVADQRVRDLMDHITVEATESPLNSIPYPCSISVNLKSGRQLRHRVEFARGLAELPLSPEELDAKFLYCSRYILPPDHIEEAITNLRYLENIENTTGLFSVLGG